MINDKTLAELKAKHPELELHHLVRGDVDVVVKSPGRGEWKKFRAEQSDDKKRPEALERLVRSCCVHPAAEELDAMLERRPAVAEVFGMQLMELAGGGEVEKKAL